MGGLERDVNEYLFHEFGVDGEEASISEIWPFKLTPIGDVVGRLVFEFDDEEPFFALARPSFNFLPKRGMSIDDLALQFLGSDWIAYRDPVSLAESRPGDDSIPSGIERNQALRVLGEQALGVQEPQILEGLFLRREQRYLGLFGLSSRSQATVVGLGPLIQVGHPECSAWRRLGWGVGQWLRSHQARLGEL